jgi:prolipoprotein diacylglyceryl transferase
MNSNNFLVWEPDPILFSIGEFTLPIPISIWGLVIAGILIYFGLQKITPQNNSKNPVEPPAWQFWGVVIGAFIIGQLPFLIIDSPTFETIGPIEPRVYGLLFAFAFISGYAIGFKMFLDAGKPQEEADRLLIYVLIATIVGARLGHVFFYEAEFYLRNIHLIPQVWTGGLASHGAAIGIIIAMYLYAKRTPGTTFLWVADRVVPTAAIGGVFIRIGNFFNSEILGMQTDLPWAVIFANVDMIPRHPSMLYESLLCIFVLSVLAFIYYKYDKNPPEGSLFGTFLIILFSGRFLIEFTKETLADFLIGATLDMGQLLSIPFVLIGVWILSKKVKW